MQLQQASAYQSNFFCKSFTLLETLCETIKAANTSIKQLTFINMPKYTYISTSNTFFPAFLAFSSISKHLHSTKSQSLLLDPAPA